MDVKTLVFSPRHRVQRHILFWLVWLTLYFMSSCVGISFAKDFRTVILVDFLVTLQAHWLSIPFCYLVVYYLMPKYAASRQYALGAAVLLSIVIVYYIASYLNFRLVLMPIVRLANFTFRDDFGYHLNLTYIWSIILYNGALGCCALIASIRFLKFWYVKQQENVTLSNENAVAELQLLKAQVHPHFLFNTLNNIYSFTLAKSTMASALAGKLSDILHYMVKEGQKNLVPLQKEIDLIIDYVSLEKVRYGKRLAIELTVLGEAGNLHIGPLLMIPFVENCFKHGSSQLLHNSIININITIKGNELQFEALNNKPVAQNQPVKMNNKGGIGLKNVKKRLQLLYPDKHTLTIHSSETMFTVKMRLSLSPVTKTDHQIQVTELTPLTYANT